MIISRSVRLRMRNVQTNVVRKSKHILHSITFFFEDLSLSLSLSLSLMCWLSLVVRSPPTRRSLSWIQSLLIELWLLVTEVSTLSLILLTTPTMVTTGILPLQGKIPMVEPEIEPGTSWLVVRSFDHQTTRLVRRSCRLWDNVERSRQVTGENMVYAHCMLDNYGYKHTLRKRNAYCFSMATMIALLYPARLRWATYRVCFSRQDGARNSG